MDKKREERIWVDLLREIDPEFPKGRVVPGESPDFTVRTGVRSGTGLEFTRLTGDKLSPDPSPSFSPALSRELLVERIRSKEAKLPLYRKGKPDQLWLVLLVEGFSHSPSFNVSNQVDNWQIRSIFDRVILLDISARKVYRVA